MAEDDVNPIQIDQVEILNIDDRMFKSWGSVEVRDRENDLLPMDEFRKIMPVIMKRGGILMDRHSNRQVGKILNYVFEEKQTSEGPKMGVMITGEIFRDYEHDDMVWEGMKKGLYKGLSFGGRNKMKDVTFDKSGLTNILTKLEGFEFSLVPGMGNQEATMEEINFLAKSKKGVKKAYEPDGIHIHAGDNLTGEHTHPEIEEGSRVLRERIEKLEIAFAELDNPSGFIELSKEEVLKPFAGFKDFDSCVEEQMGKGNSKDSATKICGSIKANVEKAEKQYSDDKNKKKTLTEKDSSLSLVSKNSDKYIKENDLNKDMEEDQIKKQDEMIEKNSNDISEISKKLDLLLKRGEEEDEEDKEKKKAEHKDEDEDDKNKKKARDEDEDEDEELEKANGSEGERKVQLPKVPAEETGGGEPAQGGEGEDVKFIEKVESAVAEEVKKQLAGLVNQNASTPRPASNLINKGEDGVAVPKNAKDVAKLLRKRNNQ